MKHYFSQYDNDEFYSILLVLNKRITCDLEIEAHSLKPYQKEVLIPTHKTQYKILSIFKDDKSHNAIITIEEVVNE